MCVCIYIYIYILLREVENRGIRRNIFLCILQMFFICPYYSETKNKEVEGKRRQAYPFSLRMICLIVHEGEREKKRRRQGMDLQVNPLPPFAYCC